MIQGTLNALAHDLTHAARSARTRRGTALFVIVSLAVPIGFMTALFGIINTVLIRPLPFRDPARLIAVWETETRGTLPLPISFPAYEAFRQQARSLSGVGAGRRNLMTVAWPSHADTVPGVVITASLLPLLGVSPVAGRTFGPDEDRPDGPAVALLAERVWRSRFGAAADTVGRSMLVDGMLATIVGVVPDIEVPNLGRPDVWVSMSIGVVTTLRGGGHAGHGSHGGGAGGAVLTDPGQRIVTVIARVAPGSDLATARAELAQISARVPGVSGSVPGGATMHVQSLQDVATARVRQPLIVLLVALALLLLIACANVAALLMSRVMDRRRDLGVQMALGCGRGRLLRQLLVEHAGLALAAGGVGWLLASWLVTVFVKASPITMPRGTEVRLDGTVLAFTIAVSVATALLCGLVPMLAARKVDVNAWVNAQSRQSRTGGASHSVVRYGLVGAQVGLAVTLVIGITLVLRSFAILVTLDPGFEADNVLTLRVDFRQDVAPPRQAALLADIVTRAAALPGVDAAAATGGMPFTGSWWTAPFTIVGEVPNAGVVQVTTTEYARLTGPYLATMGIPVVDGRDLGERDDASAPRVALVNRVFVRAFLGSGSPLGRRISLTPTEPPYEIVGVVGDTIQRRLTMDPPPMVYVRHEQNPRGPMYVAVRSGQEYAALAGAISAVVNEVSPTARVSQIVPLATLVDSTLAAGRYMSVVLMLFAAMAVLLAAVGIYGVTAQTLARRRSEIGVRLALGADPAAAVRLVVGRCLAVAVAGAAIGTAGAWWLSAGLRSILFGITSTDPATFTLVPGVLLTVAGVAAYLPARRASLGDPLRALRCE